MLADGAALRYVVDAFATRYRGRVDGVVGIESRGFIFGGPLAYALGVGLSIVRKPGKLPYDTHTVSYELEYGSDSLEIHTDALHKGSRVVLIDDLLATGGTAKAAVELLGESGIVELITLLGFYSLISMSLNVFQVPLPAGEESPFSRDVDA